jgi:hypothetical protein
MQKCPKHKIELDCIGGESAHISNWYCRICDAEQQLSEASTKNTELRDQMGMMRKEVDAYRADFLFGYDEGSVEESGYEFINCKTEECRKLWWDIMCTRMASTKRKGE